MKSEQIKKMIDEEVDIILGDFNSDYEYYNGIINDKQMQYFKEIVKLDINQINIWNTYIFYLLKKITILIFVKVKIVKNFMKNSIHLFLKYLQMLFIIEKIISKLKILN